MSSDPTIDNVPDSDVVVSEDLATLRSYELDALSSIIPPDRRDRMAEILSDDDVATLKHLAREGMGKNSLRAVASDLNYLETWSHAAIGSPLPWPTTEELILKLIAHHLYDPDEQAKNTAHGMPDVVIASLMRSGCLRTVGPHAPSSVKAVGLVVDPPQVAWDPWRATPSDWPRSSRVRPPASRQTVATAASPAWRSV